MDRVHRLGQSRDVEAFRYIATDSIEERMLELQVVGKMGGEAHAGAAGGG